MICGFGRLGKPFASQYFGVTPDMITFAKGVTSGSVPLGGVIVKKEIYDTFMQSPGAGVQFFHGYTYSGHPLASAAAIATMDTYAEEDLFNRPNQLAQGFEDGIHSFKGAPHVIDCRNLGLIGAIELAPRPLNDGTGAVAAGARGFEVFEKCWAKGVFVRPVGDTLNRRASLSPSGATTPASMNSDMSNWLTFVTRTGVRPPANRLPSPTSWSALYVSRVGSPSNGPPPWLRDPARR